MTVGIIAALPAEVGGITRSPPVIGSVARIDGGLLALAGIGPERAEGAARRLLENGACGLLSWGSAAGLTPDLAPGALLLPRRVVDEGGHALPVDPAWHARLVQALGGVTSPGLLAETRRMLETPRAKRRLGAATGAVAADMESAAVARVAAAAGVPFVVVRTVADDAGIALPPEVAAATTARGDVSTIRLLLQTLRRPASLGPLIRLGLRFRRAEGTMAAAAAALGPVGWGLPGSGPEGRAAPDLRP
jgi:adenosylhomocysteine nucleosidase